MFHREVIYAVSVRIPHHHCARRPVKKSMQCIQVRVCTTDWQQL